MSSTSPSQSYRTSHHHQQHVSKQHPRNPFQRQRRSSPPLLSPLPHNFTKSVQQACYVLTIGAVLVTLLSWAVPPGPTHDMPEMLLMLSKSDLDRKRGGVQGQALRIAGVNRGQVASAVELSKHWDADALEQSDEGVSADEDEKPRKKGKKTKKKALRQKELLEEEESAFGRREDDSDSGDAAGDESFPEILGQQDHPKEVDNDEKTLNAVVPGLERDRLVIMGHDHGEDEAPAETDVHEDDTVMLVERNHPNQAGQDLSGGVDNVTHDGRDPVPQNELQPNNGVFKVA